MYTIQNFIKICVLGHAACRWTERYDTINSFFQNSVHLRVEKIVCNNLETYGTFLEIHHCDLCSLHLRHTSRHSAHNVHWTCTWIPIQDKVSHSSFHQSHLHSRPRHHRWWLMLYSSRYYTDTFPHGSYVRGKWMAHLCHPYSPSLHHICNKRRVKLKYYLSKLCLQFSTDFIYYSYMKMKLGGML